ncbi:uncharacterized protein MYCGRDRAFT_96914 [Zymoseptoria tritici IPO323]|uniref:Uncharacterized protein n=1 Tax=Zymoseptoria tritici (strain CBS 115943 / IPO323) TaxID=336722 RepID=F9XPH2_ZYMTI|nr:uncharacterized protein MYCGRDRAFT_96914 [Zymoseptoria tritici IPO323]EGP83202.1 hypothetical protein MYCGRDRAFT_96914 [Zymoseptoria tritici IPO323]
MENQMDPPPAYEATEQEAFLSQARAADQDALLDRLTDHIRRQRIQNIAESLDTSAEARSALEFETRRIRSMLKFTLAADYQIWDSAPNLSAVDREHFLFMVRATRELESALPVRPTPEERQVLAAYFWKHLHQPCKALSLPLESVFQSIVDLSEFVNAKGHYKGSVQGILHTRGFKGLATKLWMDCEIVIPAVFDTGTEIDESLALHLKARNYCLRAMYFKRIYGVKAESSVRSIDAARAGLPNADRPRQAIMYSANERGIAYASSRKAAILAMGKDLTSAEWMGKVGACVHNVLRRVEMWQSGVPDSVEVRRGAKRIVPEEALGEPHSCVSLFRLTAE